MKGKTKQDRAELQAYKENGDEGVRNAVLALQEFLEAKGPENTKLKK